MQRKTNKIQEETNYRDENENEGWVVSKLSLPDIHQKKPYDSFRDNKTSMDEKNNFNSPYHAPGMEDYS